MNQKLEISNIRLLLSLKEFYYVFIDINAVQDKFRICREFGNEININWNELSLWLEMENKPK